MFINSKIASVIGAAALILSLARPADAGGLMAYYTTTYNNMFAWCTNPALSTKSGGPAGTVFGIERFSTQATGKSGYIFVGFSNGIWGGSTSAFNGTFADDYYYISPYSYETFYGISLTPDSGTSTFSTGVENANHFYNDVSVNGTQEVTGLYQPTVGASQMGAGLNDTAGGTYFDNFTSGSNCSGLQTYTTSWQNWSGTPTTVASDPSGQTTAYDTYTSSGGANYFYIYP